MNVSRGIFMGGDPEGKERKASILMVDGTAATNIDGNVPGVKQGTHPMREESFYKKISDRLNEAGYSTLRYARPGVYEDRTIKGGKCLNYPWRSCHITFSLCFDEGRTQRGI